jgi:hypothetical protein
MTVRIRYKITATVSSTSAEERDLANQAWEVVNDAQGEGGSWKTTLAAGATDVQLNLGNLAACRMLFVRTTAKDPTQVPGDIVVKRNSTGGETLTVRPLTDAKEGFLAFVTDSLTALYASNPGTVVMDVVVVAAGD